MGKLVKGTLWVKEQFEKGSRPGRDKIIQWISDGDIPGQIIAGEPFVDADRFILRDHTGRSTFSANDDNQPKCGIDLLAS